jgi:hypothetical protein
MAEHLVSSKLERLSREAVRLQCDPVLMGILKDCTAFYFRVKQSKSRHVGQRVCEHFRLVYVVDSQSECWASRVGVGGAWLKQKEN